MTDNARGAMLMLAAMAGFTVNDAVMKLAFAELPFFQAIALRSAMAAALLGLIAHARGQLVLRFSPRDARLIGWRTLGEVGSTLAFLTALAVMPLADITAILQALPLAVTLAAALFLGEPVGWRRLSAIGVGFAGVMLIVKPGTSAFQPAALLALLAVALVVLRDLSTRQMSAVVPSLSVAFLAAVAVGLVGVAGTALSGEWAVPAPGDVALVAGAAASLVVGYLTIVMAARTGAVAVVTPFRYAGLLWALVLGIALFGEVPDGWTLAGAGLVVATGLFTFWREHRLARMAGDPRATVAQRHRP